MSKQKEKDEQTTKQDSGNTAVDEGATEQPEPPKEAPAQDPPAQPEEPRAQPPEAPPPAPSASASHEALHPNGGMPPLVAAWLLEAFDAKGKGIPVGVRSREVSTAQAKYQCSINAAGDRAVVYVHPMPGQRHALESAYSTAFEANRLHEQQVKEYEAAIHASETGKRPLAGPHMDAVRQRLAEAVDQAAHTRRTMKRLTAQMERLPVSYKVAFAFDKWVAPEYALRAYKAGDRKPAKAEAPE